MTQKTCEDMGCDHNSKTSYSMSAQSGMSQAKRREGQQANAEIPKVLKKIKNKLNHNNILSHQDTGLHMCIS